MVMQIHQALYISAVIFAALALSVLSVSSSYVAHDYGLTSLDGYIAAVGDFNGDKHTDLFVVRENDMHYYVDLYLWNTKTDTFTKKTLAHPIVETLPILALTPGDFNYDGHLDLLVTGLNTDGSSYVHIYVGDVNDFTAAPFATINPLPVGELLVFDSNNNLKLDLYGMRYSADPALTGVRTVWVYRGNDAQTNPTYNAVDATLADNDFKYLKLGVASSTVDIDGDCLADLFIVSSRLSPAQQLANTKTHTAGDVDADTRYELWLNSKGSGAYQYTFNAQYPAAVGALQPSFTDVNADGAIDVIVPVCYPAVSCADVNELDVFYNLQKPMCTGSDSTSTCRGQADLCSSDPAFNLGGGMQRGSLLHVNVPTAAFGTKRFSVPAAGSTLSFKNPPFSVRTGDYDINGYPDLLIALTDSTAVTAVADTGILGGLRSILRDLISPAAANDVTVGNTTRFIEVWRNLVCTKDLYCSDNAVTHAFYTFTALSTGLSVADTADGYAATFVDIGNNGDVDALVLKQTVAGGSVATFRNEFKSDAYFLALLGSNGICPAWCSGIEFPNPKPYGVSQPGVTFKFTVTSLGGHKSPRQSSLLTQSAYLPLLTPYQVVGIGRTSNYIEELFAGFTIGPGTHYNKFTAVIPNSQIVVFPYPPDDPESWILELFISPTSKALSVTIAILIALAAIGVTILVLQYKENVLEKKEKRANQHLFAF